ncbi:MAG: FAD-binding oxidoreductase [Spirochaetales bacterium]|nr:FAD-binding oxidoreductase [Spirochaetales bacterium]
MNKNNYDCIIIGAGFTGLSAAYELLKRGRKIALVEKEKVHFNL